MIATQHVQVDKDISDDIGDQYVAMMQNCKYSAQLDEVMDVSKSLLLVFIMFHTDFLFVEDILVCKE